MKGFELYNQAQWEWIAKKHSQGYRLYELGDFLGLHRETVRRNLQRIGALPSDVEFLPPLSTYRSDFNRLGEKK